MTEPDRFRVLVLGAAGQFGKRLCHRLANIDHIEILLGGRQRKNLEAIQKTLACPSFPAVCNVRQSDFDGWLANQNPNLVIHLAGPFQGQNYHVANAALAAGIPYIDMADGHDFVNGFSILNGAAVKKNVSLITGASTVPGLSAILADSALADFRQLTSIDYGICAGLKTGLGLATLQSTLSYCGRGYNILQNGKPIVAFGLAEPRTHVFSPPIGGRKIVNCEIPDLSLFLQRYPDLKNITFGGGIDAPGLAQLLSFMSLCVRRKLIKDWNFLSGAIKPFMGILKPLGSSHSGFFMRLSGQGKNGAAKSVLLEIIARDGSGLEIPITPVMLLIKRMLRGETLPAGAYPCMGLFTLAAFEDELATYPISFIRKDIS